MSASPKPLTAPAQLPTLSVGTLNLLSTFLDEIIREENLCHRAQVILHRIAPAICLLANSEDSIFTDLDHPARKILLCIVQIAKLSGEQFEPGDVLYQTLLESIQTLRNRNVSGYQTLRSVLSDLEHVLKLARMRAPIEIKSNLDPGKVSDAKTVAALMIMRQCHRFDVSDTLLLFVLTEWLEMVVITLLQQGRETGSLKVLERLTFSLLYLGSNLGGERRASLQRYFILKLYKQVAELETSFMGYTINFTQLQLNAARYIGVDLRAD